MGGLKLKRLPDRNPVKLTIMVPPELGQRLADYARAYEEAYGSVEPVADLVPAILSSFLDSDRQFVKARRRDKAGG